MAPTARAETAAEKAVLGCILAKFEAYYDIDLSAQEFQTPEYRAVYKAITELAFAGEPVDPVTIASRLQNGNAERVAERVAGYRRFAADPRRIAVYAAQVREAALERDTRQCLAECQRYTDRGSALLQRVQTQVVALGETERAAPSVRAGEVSKDLTNEARRRRAGEAPRRSEVLTGVPPFDEWMALERGGVVVIAGRPSMGKTSMARWMIRGLLSQGERVGIFSTECNKEQTVAGFQSDLTGIPFKRILSRKLTGDEMVRLAAADAVIRGWPLWIDDARNELGDVQREINRLKAAEGATTLVVDYLQEMTVADLRIRDERGAMNAIVTGLRHTCRNGHRASLIALSQLNRKPEGRENKRPMLSDLAESGKLEAAADMVMLMFRPGYYFDDADKTQLDVPVAKNRFGPVGMIQFVWDPGKGLIEGIRDEVGHVWKVRGDEEPPAPPPARAKPQQKGLLP